MEKIDIRDILKSHLKTIKNANSGKPDRWDYFTFAFLPLLISSILVYLKVEIKSEITTVIITTLAIFVGLMLNVIVLIFDIVKRDSSQEIKNEVLKQLLSNISFEILLALFAIITILFSFSDIIQIKLFFSWLSFMSITLFLLTLLMILKRLNNVFKNELEQNTKN
jgi:uncharacterized membrane protein YhaH (DUF805 family)